MEKEEIISIMEGFMVQLVPSMESVVITPNHSLKELGLDSIERMEIINSTMEEVGVEIVPKEFINAKNIGDIAEIMRNKLENKKQLEDKR
jgi:polyketide biosynthesis acyl carrier protein